MESDTPRPTQSNTSTPPFSSPKVNIAVDSIESSIKTNLKSQAVTSELQSPVDDEGPTQTLPFLDDQLPGTSMMWHRKKEGGNTFLKLSKDCSRAEFQAA